MENRLMAVRKAVAGYIARSDNLLKNSAHAHGVAGFAALLAAKRGLDPVLAGVMGLLHDIHYIIEGTYNRHDVLGAEKAEKILRDTGLFSEEEIKTVFQAISRHDLRQEVHEPYDEVLKDADIIYPYFTELPEVIKPDVAPRISSVIGELGL